LNKTFIIFKHEFLRTVKRTGFIILTLALPILALLAIGIFRFAEGVTKPAAEINNIGYVDEIGGFTQFTSEGNILFIQYDNESAAKQALVDKDIKEYFLIPPEFIATGIIERYTAQKELSAPEATAAAIKKFVSSNLLVGKVSEDVVTRIEGPLNLVTTTLTATGEVAPEQGGFGNFIVPGIFSFLLALALIFNSIYVLQSLSEEKENRLMEILLSSVSTRQLLTGKVLGLGLAGLLQVVVWVVTLPLILLLASSTIGGFLSTIHVPVSFWVLGVVYFLLGFALYAVLSAGVAAVSPTVQEAQGISGIYTMLAVAPFWFLSLLMFFPNNPVWVVFSIFPFSAPVLVLLRIGVSGVPVWQIAVSIAVLLLTIFGGMLLSAKLLKIYLLMYGKRPKLGQIIKSLRQG
jgi:ABC-2 type transport system permease protein